MDLLQPGVVYAGLVGELHQINTSGGGVPKLPVDSAEITRNGLVGDVQADLQYHGGPERAVCLFSKEVIETFQGEGHPIEAGSVGENLTVSGLDWATLTPGVKLSVGPAVVLEIASYTSPCAKNAQYFADGDFTRMMQSRHPGESRLYARVEAEGTVTTGDEVTILD